MMKQAFCVQYVGGTNTDIVNWREMLSSVKFAVILVCTIAVSEECPEVVCGQNKTVQRFISNLDDNNDTFLTQDELYDLAGVGPESVPGLILKEAVMSTFMTAGVVGSTLLVGPVADSVCAIGLSKDDLKCTKKWLLCKRVVNLYYNYIDIDNDSRLSKEEIKLGFVFQDMNGDGRLSFQEMMDKRPSI